MNILEIKNLTTQFDTSQGPIQAVRDLSYTLKKGEILGIVGESGSGKSVGMLSVMGLLAENGRVASGDIFFDGENISPVQYQTKEQKKNYEKRMMEIRGNEIGMIFQDPMTFLNPVLKIGKQISEVILCHKKCSKKSAKLQTLQLMEKVGIPSPEKRYHQYPFEFSGGMRQRIIIAIALACNPKLIIADEPTTALDVTVQAQVLELIQKITKENNTSVILITHDLGVVANSCDRIVIMYGGQIVEEGTAEEIFYQPKHPYTQGLLKSVYKDDGGDQRTLIPIPGTPPDLLNLNTGCAFMPRCEEAMKICQDYIPQKTNFSETQSCLCWNYCKQEAESIVSLQDGKGR